MIEDASVDRLVRLGLTSYEARAYVALVRRDASTAAEVARIAGVPRPRIYDVVDGLVAKGLAVGRPGKTVRFVATRPEEALDQLVSAHRQRLGLLEQDAAAVVAALGPAFRDSGAHIDPLDFIEVIRSPAAIAKRFAELEEGVTREQLVFSKPPYTVTVDRNLAGLAVARRAVLRSVYELSILDDPDSRRGVKAFVDAGEEVRFVEVLPMKLGIMDERIVLMAMPDPVAGGAELTTLVVENSELAQCLKIAFGQVWDCGEPLDAACRRRGVPIPD